MAPPLSVAPPPTWRLPHHGASPQHGVASPPSSSFFFPFLSSPLVRFGSGAVGRPRVLPAGGEGRRPRSPGPTGQPPARGPAACEPGGAGMLWLLCGPSRAMESHQVLVIRIKIPDGGAVDWTVHSAPQLLFRDVLVSECR